MLSRVALAAVLLAAMAVLMVPQADAEGEAESVTLYGYVGDVSNEMGNIPLDGVVVRIVDSRGSTIAESATGTEAAGKFVLTYSADSDPAGMTFTKEGYTVRTWPESVFSKMDSGVFAFDYSWIIPDEDGRYRLTSDVSGGSFIGMGLTEGHIFGNVYSESGKGLSGARVSVTSSDGQVFSTTAGNNGYFDIQAYYGTYTMEVTCKGFQDSGKIEVSTLSPSIIVTLTEKDHTLFFGLDVPHTLEVIGLIITILVLLIAGAAIARSRRGKPWLTIVNDLDQQDEEDEYRRRFGSSGRRRPSGRGCCPRRPWLL